MLSLQAIGKIALYQTVLGSLLMSNVIIGYILFKFGYPPEAIFVSGALIAVLTGFGRVLFLQKIAKVSVKLWLKNVVFKSVLCVLHAFFISFIILYSMEEGFLRLAFVSVSNSVAMILFINFLGITENEQKIFR